MVVKLLFLFSTPMLFFRRASEINQEFDPARTLSESLKIEVD